MRNYLKHGMVVTEHECVRYLEHIGKACKYGGLLFLGISVYEVSHETSKAYNEHADWLAELVGGAAGMAATYGLGVGLLSVCVPAGVIFILVNALVEGAGLFSLEKLVKDFFKNQMHDYDVKPPEFYRHMTSLLQECLAGWHSTEKVVGNLTYKLAMTA